MGTISKTIYEAPTIHLKQVMMESDIMAASNERVVQMDNTRADINRQDGFEEHVIGGSAAGALSWDE